jgi:4-coumarate--CoA ligase
VSATIDNDNNTLSVWYDHVKSGANPTYNVEELLYQIRVVKAAVIIAHSSSLHTALGAARVAGIPSDRVITFDESGQPTVDSIIQLGLRNKPAFVERRLKKGEAKTKVALLSFSSGTTGKPKVRSRLPA